MGIIQYGRSGKAMHVLHISLPLGVTLQINQWNEAGEGAYMNGKIGMSSQPNQDGHWGKTPINPGNRPDMNDCPPGTSKNAKEVCRKKEKTFFPSPACLVDVCFGGGIM